jgi:cytosine/adenosine deaminase-related metal-dependent hydrolase
MSINPHPPALNHLRARIVLPVSRPPIEDGLVSFAGNRIVSVGSFCDAASVNPAQVQDLGDVILMPGLVNAHCHLDYTNMAGQIPPVGKFVDWLKSMTTGKSGWGYTDFAESWLHGAKMLLHTGTTTVGDIEMVPELLPEVWTATPLRVFSFLELTGVKSRRPPTEILREALEKIISLPPGRSRAALSPHAPYSTTAELIRIAAEAATKQNLRVATHVAESDQEFEMFSHGKGEMFDWIARNNRDMSDCGLHSPVQHLERQGALHQNLLAVHVNYLAPGDAKLLARRKVSVVHCPRSHDYFRHRPFPLAELADAGVNICLGTDSLVSVYKKPKQKVALNMFEEMRSLAKAHSSLSPETILPMATVNGAHALGMAGQIGELTPGALADMIAIHFTGKVADANAAALHHTGNVSATMIDGQWA